MRLLIAGLALIVAACAQLPDEPPQASHICVETPNGLVECSEIP